jgi:hypothetical protein
MMITVIYDVCIRIIYIEVFFVMFKGCQSLNNLIKWINIITKSYFISNTIFILIKKYIHLDIFLQEAYINTDNVIKSGVVT